MWQAVYLVREECKCMLMETSNLYLWSQRKGSWHGEMIYMDGPDREGRSKADSEIKVSEKVTKVSQNSGSVREKLEVLW